MTCVRGGRAWERARLEELGDTRFTIQANVSSIQFCKLLLLLTRLLSLLLSCGACFCSPSPHTLPLIIHLYRTGPLHILKRTELSPVGLLLPGMGFQPLGLTSFYSSACTCGFLTVSFPDPQFMWLSHYAPSLIISLLSVHPGNAWLCAVWVCTGQCLPPLSTTASAGREHIYILPQGLRHSRLSINNLLSEWI